MIRLHCMAAPLIHLCVRALLPHHHHVIILLFGLSVVLLNEIISPSQVLHIKAKPCEYMIILTSLPQNIDNLPMPPSPTVPLTRGFIYYLHLLST